MTAQKKHDIEPAQTDEKNDLDPQLIWKYGNCQRTGRYTFEKVELSDQSEVNIKNLQRAFKRATGSSNLHVGERIIHAIAQGMTHETKEDRLNHVSALLPALNPQDEIEALLLGQFLTLQNSGMKCLRQANHPDQGFYHEERLFLLAQKLFNTANQTMQTVIKYRTKGQQTMQVVHLHNEGQAIVTQSLSNTPPKDTKKKK